MRTPTRPRSPAMNAGATGWGVGPADQSRESKPLMTSSNNAQSTTVRVIGPTCATGANGLGGYIGTRPSVGLSPTIPQNAAGIRIEPPPSVPTDNGPSPAARAAALPPLEPPDVRSVDHGLRVMPVRGLSVTPFQPNSGVVTFPSGTAPAARSRATAGASTSHRCVSGRSVSEPRSVGQPSVSRRSLIDTGTPSSGPSGVDAA